MVDLTNNSSANEKSIDKDQKSSSSDPKANPKDKEVEISEEDQKLIDELDMLVERLSESDSSIHKPALEQIRTLLKSSSGTMTSVPKPLKFLKVHYPALKNTYSQWPASPEKQNFADILSLLGMAYDVEGVLDCIKFRFEAGVSEEKIFNWGHEYIRHLAMEVASVSSAADESICSSQQAVDLTVILVKFFFQHNAESDAVDLLHQINFIELITELADKNTYERTCRYLIACSPLVAPPNNRVFLEVARELYTMYGTSAQCLEISLKLNRPDFIEEDFKKSKSRAEKIQLAFMLSQQQIYLPELAGDDPLVLECMENSKLSERFLDMAAQLNLMDPKVPEDIYKTNLENSRFTGPTIDSAKQNLASTFVNAFVNAGFGIDKLMTSGDDGNAWVYKNRDSGMLSASASIGMISLWDVEKGLGLIDKYLYTSDTYIKSGAVLGIGILTSSVTDDTDSAKALLSEYLEDPNLSSKLKSAALSGLGLSYAGSQRDDIIELLSPFISDTDISTDLASIASLSAGLVCIGSCNGDVASTIIQAIMERSEAELDKPFTKYMILGLALLYFGRPEEAEATIETLKAIDYHPIGIQGSVLVNICSYAGSGDVLQIQKLLEICGAHPTSPEADESKDDSRDSSDESEEASPPSKIQLHQMFAVLGISMISMAEPVGAEMAYRSFSHLMHYGEPEVKRAVPLAIGLLHVSNPTVTVLETLSKYSHDSDSEIACNAILAMGYVGAGTNNARLAQMLRQLASYYYKSPDCLFLVRIAQGLVHMAKGAMTLSPLHFDRGIVSPLALASLLIPLITSTSPKKQSLLGSCHYMLYYLVRAMSTRQMATYMLSSDIPMDSSKSSEKDSEDAIITDEDEEVKLVPVPVSVRVGQSVEAVGQAGKPKTLSGFQTHSTPVLLSHGERAELATEEYLTVANNMERFVILVKNPDFE
ncbi:26S proteasome non-ATPase regulatory subunit 2 [Smittium culicis]|uniref:26S proteasome regulatory subunit RPN1 n=1 Tax=Smittium culicis TaxID=133412 RepID=A0A1R1XZ07_9FUNG|nr:26S proteasome non-ATPase regulatory subunit 2 [Smittium culicis]OMJ23288.1 26S proteasome non-ATPase regulatory subunit 2 [Smittium culicis]